MNILVTGGAGFIGSSLIDRLLNLNHEVTCLDNFHDFYDKTIKLKNIQNASASKKLKFIEDDILNINQNKILQDTNFDVIVHLAGLAGVIPSITHSANYLKANVMGTNEILEYSRRKKISKVVVASSSSVYGVNPKFPWTEDTELSPISPYAVSKLACEKLCYSHSHLYDSHIICLRFFTVFGPRQRPDLAIHKFIRQMLNQEQINVYGNGSTIRDYTYIDDIISGIIGSINYDKSKFEIINLGNNNPLKLIDLISILSEVTGKEAHLGFFDERPGDVPITYADISKANRLIGYEPIYNLKQGILNQYKWMTEND